MLRSNWRNHIPEDRRRDFREIERQARADARRASKAEKLEMARTAHDSALDNARDPHRPNGPFLRFVRRCPCLFCALEDRQQVTNTEAAHVRRSYPNQRGWRPVGAGETPHDFRALPQCVEHHREGEDAQHAHDNHDWYADRGVYPPEVCAELMQAHLAGADPVETIKAIAETIRRDLPKSCRAMAAETAEDGRA